MDDRNTIKQREFAHLKEISRKQPELFKQNTFFDDAETLRSVGIELPNKNNYPIGYLKLWPQDFIVEEISPEGQVYTVTYENLISDNSPVKSEDQTIYATLVKCGLSTIDVVEDICKITGCTREQIQYAGIKDKDALTAQRISFRNIPLDKLRQISSPNFFLKDVISGKGSVQKSGLQGNRFTILIRTESDFASTEKFYTFAEQLKITKKDGFYNFYYLQRFGTPRLVNYEWALTMLKGNYKQAVYDILTQQTLRELPFFKQIRKELIPYLGDWQAIQNIIAPFPLMFISENKLVAYLKDHPEDYIGALNQIPDQITLWVYALSSYLFNRRLSESAISQTTLPKELPLFLSSNRNDWMVYEKFLKEKNIYPPLFNNYRPFRYIQLRQRIIQTKEYGVIHKAEIVPEGIVMSFSLQKGGYATTFLSHMFNLISGLKLETISSNKIDIKETINETSLKNTVSYFDSVIKQKEQSFFEETPE